MGSTDKKASKQEVSDQPSGQLSCSSTTPSSFLAIFAIAVAGLSLYYSYKYLQQHELSSAQSVKQQSQIALLRESQDNLQRKLDRQQSNIGALESSLNHMRLKNSSDSENWALAEVEYLVKLATYNLTFDQNTMVATKLLEEADQRLQAVPHANFAGLRAALAKDVASLNAAPKIDTEGIVIRLSALSDMVGTLPLTDYKEGVEGNVASLDAPSEGSEKWQGKLKQSFKSLKDAIIIRRLDQPLKPMLSPAQHANLTENIQMQLFVAQWAVLHRSDKLFQHSLQNAIDWIKDYMKATGSTQALLTGLNSLKEINVAPAVPMITASQEAIKSAISQKSQQFVPSQLPQPPEPASTPQVLSS